MLGADAAAQPVHDNRLQLQAMIVELMPTRYTPAGLPAQDLLLEHQSVQEEAGHVRQVRAVMKAVAIGTVAERLAHQAVGSQWRFTGFLASARNAKHPVFHIQAFLPH